MLKRVLTIAAVLSLQTGNWHQHDNDQYNTSKGSAAFFLFFSKSRKGLFSGWYLNHASYVSKTNPRQLQRE